MSDFLAREGITVFDGYAAAQVGDDVDLVVVGNAISRGNVELESVLDRSLRYASLPETIREAFLWDADAVVIAGTHGKTTTTALTAWVLTCGGLDPSMLVGGLARNFGDAGASYRVGAGRAFVIEGDEYDSAYFDKTAKFLKYLPVIAVVNNVEFDHADIYADLDEVRLAFARFVRLVPRRGLVLLGADSPDAAALAAHAHCPVQTFGLGAGLDWRAEDLTVQGTTTSFVLTGPGGLRVPVTVPLLGAHNVRNALAALVVALEVGVALVVMASAALVTLTTVRLLQVDRGFDASRLTIMRITLPVNRYDGERSLAFFDGLLARVRALPYVRHASASNQPPPGVFSRAQFEIEGQPPRAGATLPSTFFSTVASSYRETIGLRLKQGRWFDETAPATGTREVVVNAAFAARYFADRSPVGQRVRVQAPAGDGLWTNIVGLVDDVRNAGLSANPQPEMLASVRQIPERRRTQLYVVARTRDAGDPIAADVRGIVQSIDPEQPIYAVSTIEQQFANGVSSRRAAAWVLGFFCVLSAGLAGLGIFGVLSFAANERAREIAVRVALGGRRSSIVRLMLSQAMRPVVAGLLLGGAMVILGERVIAGWAFGVTPEPAVVAGVAVALFVVGLVASAWPAIRASRTSPVDALRGS
jgi:hypothetical protein